MKIAYYEENNYHTEIIGVFLYYFFLNELSVTVFNDNDKSGYINYYKNIHDFELKKIKDIHEIYNEYDYIIIGTSYSIDNIKNIYPIIQNKIIFVCHLMENINIEDKRSNNCIVLSPINKINNSCQYIMPIHNFISSHHIKKKNILTLIGRFKDNNRDTKDIIKIISEHSDLNYEIHIYSRHIKFVPKILFELSKKYPDKLKIFLKVKMENLEKKIKASKFLLTLVSKNSWYHKDRLSGIIPLAFNYDIPLIMDKNLNNIYKFKSPIMYQDSISEIIKDISTISDNDYIDLVEKVKSEKKYIINQNNIVLNNLLK